MENLNVKSETDEYCHKGFKHVVKDEIFYNENVYKWFPNPTLPKEEQTRDKEKLLSVSFEKEGYTMFVIAPKCYILKSSKNENDVKKMKDVSFRLNNNIELESCKSYLLKSSNPVMGINRGFMVVESHPYSHTRHMIRY
jgi:hypothetical protein